MHKICSKLYIEILYSYVSLPEHHRGLIEELLHVHITWKKELACRSLRCYTVNQSDTNYVCHMTTGDRKWGLWEAHPSAPSNGAHSRTTDAVSTDAHIHRTLAGDVITPVAVYGPAKLLVFIIYWRTLGIYMLLIIQMANFHHHLTCYCKHVFFIFYVIFRC